ncbi:unnamed protein product [Phytomonas sp. Hart1]|nr:unnamed protein product [Phytomonas sp. Hart1]|eukprot:CCW72033.1 unnamed protein product [Phytomonas sp. isolate Hart1]
MMLVSPTFNEIRYYYYYIITFPSFVSSKRQTKEGFCAWGAISPLWVDSPRMRPCGPEGAAGALADRFYTTSPCGANCPHFPGPPGGNPPPFLAMRPYFFDFNAHAKGRWVGRPLLTVCVREFAWTRPPREGAGGGTGTLRDPTGDPLKDNPRNNSKDTDEDLLNDLHHDTLEVGEGSLDARLTLPAFIAELCEGTLWLDGRAEECRAAGRRLRAALITQRPGAETPKGDWAAAVEWLRGLPTVAAAEHILEQHLPSLLVLHQRDILRHRIWRREGRIFADAPLHILRCDLRLLHDDDAPRETAHPPRGKQTTKQKEKEKEALVVVSKPPGLPVHPSGAYHKNTITSLLTDVLFGGPAAVHYSYVKYPPRPADGVPAFASIYHRTEGFELIRVWIAAEVPGEDEPPPNPSTFAMGVREEDWELIKRGLDGGRGGWRPFVVHRLDAATSGVLIFALNAASARATATLIAQKEAPTISSGVRDGNNNNNNNNGSCVKHYLALVEGKLDVEALAEGGILQTDPCQPPSPSTMETTEEVDTNGVRKVGNKAGNGVEPHLGKYARTEREDRREFAKASPWLRVERAIGCLSPQQSLYWCAGEKRTARWRRRRHLFNEMVNPPPAGKKRKSHPGCSPRKTCTDAASHHRQNSPFESRNADGRRGRRHRRCESSTAFVK